MSVFADEWRRCLKEQYKYVIKSQDKLTEQSLITVMHEVGFSERELTQLRVEATMRADEMPDDFMPEMDIHDEPKPEIELPQEFKPHPLECQCPACVEANLTPHDAEGQPLEYESEEELAEIIEERQKDDDDPEQLSMF